AREALYGFIRQSWRSDRRCLRIVHGKGLGSEGRTPVLKSKVRSWLMQLNEVLAFCQAPAHEGGSGAVIVLLRSSR
ncbi:MAG: Smr/MutS family protein, partial [Burkholderiaceae bacterium]